MHSSVKVLVTGDTHLGGGRVKHLALSNAVKELFGDFLMDIRETDLAITNLESPMSDDGEPILKTGPNIKSPVETLQVLQKAGFDLLTLANNHIMDYGKDGLHTTLETCSKAGLYTVGAGSNKEEAQKSFNCEISGMRISVVNIAENEFGTTSSDDIPGAHALNPVQNYYAISEAGKESDRVLVIVHGGHESYPLPSPRMKETYRFFVDAGADAVVGHHPHCYSGYEIYNNAPIFYSIGNFLFDKGCQPPDDWNLGYMVQLELGPDSLDFELIPYIQNAEEPGIRKLTEDEYVNFGEKISRLNKIISDDEELEKSFDAFVETSKNKYSSYIEPHAFRYIHTLRNRNLFPSFLTDRKKRLLLNLTRCEAHRDVLLKILDK